MIESSKRDGVTVHILDESEVDLGLYALTQTSDEIKDGDVLVIPTEGIVGFLCGAWPVVIIGPGDGPFNSHGFHSLNWEGRDDVDHPASKYEASILVCCAVAEEDADITGWGSAWTEQAESVRELIGR